jgi:hypothetical protein
MQASIDVHLEKGAGLVLDKTGEGEIKVGLPVY